MTTYGNTYWNLATNNEDKAVIPLKEEAFAALEKLLQNAGQNYFAYAQKGFVKLAVNKKDLPYFKQLIGEPLASQIKVQEAAKPYSPPEQNIFGNVQYRYIPKKSYISADTDVALKTAELLNARGVNFSGRVSGEKTTITVSEADRQLVKELQEQIISQRKQFAHKLEKSEIIGNISYREIRNKNIYFSDLRADKYPDIKPYLDSLNIPYSGVIKKNRVTFTVDESNVQEFHSALAFAINKAILSEEMQIAGYSISQQKLLNNFIDYCSESDNTFLVEMYLNPKYTNEQLLNISELASKFWSQPFKDRIYDADGITNLINAKKTAESHLMMTEITENREFTAQQKGQILAALKSGINPGALTEAIDESYTPEDIATISDFINNGDIHGYNSFQSTKERPFQIDSDKGSKSFIKEPTVDLKEPTVEILWSENNEFEDGQKMLFSEANRLFAEMDKQQRIDRENPDNHAGWYKKTSFRVTGVLPNGEDFSYEGRYDIGDGDGTLLEHITDFYDYYSKDPHMKNYHRNQGEEAYQQYLDEIEHTKNVLIPFLAQFSGQDQQIEAVQSAREASEPTITHPKKTEELESADSYSIYQVKNENEYRNIRFAGYDEIARHGLQPNHTDYDMVYTGKLSDIPYTDKLDGIFTVFNTDEQPHDFTGRSLSVSDVVVLHQDGKDTAHYVDRIGFRDIPDFLQERKLPEQVFDDLLLQYFQNEKDFSVIIDKTMARDEMAEIAEEIIPAEQAEKNKIAQKYLTDGSMMFYLPESNEKMREVQITKDEFGATFRSEDISVTYTWNEIADFYTVASQRYLDAEKKVEQAYQKEEEKYADLYSALRENRDVYLSATDKNSLNIADARKDIFHNLRIHYQDGTGYVLLGDSDKEKDLMLRNFTQVNERIIRNYLEQNGYTVTGYANKELPLEEKTISNDITVDLYRTENPDIFYIKGKASVARIDINASDEIWQRFSEHGLIPQSADEKKIILDTDGHNWNRFAIPDKWGNVTNNIEAEKVLSESELNIMHDVATAVIEGSHQQDRQLSIFDVDTDNVKSERQLKATDVAPEKSLIINQKDIDILRTLEPRKSVLNFSLEERKAASAWANRFKEELSEKSPFYRCENGEWRDKENTKIPVINIENRYKDFRGVRIDIKIQNIERGKFVNNDTGWTVQVSRGGLEDSVKYGFKHHDTAVYDMLYQLPDIIKNSVLLDSTVSEKNNPNKAHNTAFMHKMYSVCKIDEEPCLAKLTVEEFADGKGDTLKRMYNVQDIKIEPLRLIEFTDKQLARSVLNSSEISIADLFSVVKMFDRDFYINKQAQQQIVNSEHKTPYIANYQILENDISGGAKTKFRHNVDAFKTLRNIEAENRPATSEEQNILAQYVGWGGLAPAFDKENSAWANEYAELKELLSESEYSSARASTLDAFYTPPAIIESIYTGLEKMGFEGGNILDPAMGIGNFFGKLPPELAENTKLYGVEIDDITGRIAKQLYPGADITVNGFEHTEFQNGVFDVAVGNVPFGDFSVSDKDYDNLNLKIHDYFFAKSLDKVKDGGIVAFITSKGTLDKQDSSFRQYLADRADLIGAIRLPNNAFKAYAGTEVTADIIFLQKRNAPASELSADWVNLGQTEDGLKINSYFAAHPEMVLGNIVAGNKLYGDMNDTMCIPTDGADLKLQLQEAVQNLNAKISDYRTVDVRKISEKPEVRIPEGLRNYSFFEADNRIYFKYNNQSCKWRMDNKHKNHARAKAYIALRDCTRELLDAQEQDKPDSVISDLQDKLNTLYDTFYAKYGLLHSQSNKRLFSEDISYPLISSLEAKIDKEKLLTKSDIFTKRTIMPAKPVAHVETAMEALTLSVAERAAVDFEYMERLTDISKNILIEELRGEIYPNPMRKGEYLTASEYLSGDIRQKLNAAQEAAAQENGDIYAENIKALEQALPEPLKAADIDVKLGATWIEPEIYQQFMYELFQTPENNKVDADISRFQKHKPIKIDYSDVLNEWRISNKSVDRSVYVTKSYGTENINAYDILEDCLNLREPKIYMSVYDQNKIERRVLDPVATKLAQKRAEKIRAKFKDWIFENPERREKLVKQYNDTFNSIRPREYDGSNLAFPGMNPEIELHSHQKNAIAHALYGGNTLFAHSVGAGKTFEMIAAAMESKRLGLCHKSLFAVPNHLTEQVGDDFLKLYPNANILVATKKDFQKANRQELIAKIATGNWDAVIIGHSQLGMIPISAERQIVQIEEQIDDITIGIAEMKKAEGSKFQIKALEKTKRNLENKLHKLESSKKDDTVCFEQLGVDKLFVDEAHEFKNLFTVTKLQNVSGISSSASQKSFDLFMKCQYLDEITGGKGIVFATGTPLSNSVTELHTMMRYLQYDFLRRKNMQNFDNWVSTFGEQKTEWQLAPAGNKYKLRTRIANYSNLPELMSMYKQCADIRTADTLNLKVPECEMHIVNVEATEFQKTLVQELADRADDVQDGRVSPETDNMLRITGDGRKVGLDPRLINPEFEDNPNTKLNQCVNNVKRIYDDTAAEKLTQIIFCDLGVPHKKINAELPEESEDSSVAALESLEEQCDFCVYDDIKKKLVAKGVAPEEIAFIHDANTEQQKAAMFEKVRNGDIRILIGSTGKMGTGTNVQDKLVALHDLDIPWRPADLEQRRGRMVRQGNHNKQVHLYRYVTKGTFDAYSYQTLENKQQFISQIMTSKSPVRKCEDVDQQALTYSEIKALCTGDERIKEKMTLENDVKDLLMQKSEYKNTRYDMQNKIQRYPEQKNKLERHIEALKKDLNHVNSLKIPLNPETNEPEFRITLNEIDYTDKKAAAKELESCCMKTIGIPDKPVTVGNYLGFPLSVEFSSVTKSLRGSLNGAVQHKFDLSTNFGYNIRKMNVILNGLDKEIAVYQDELHKLNINCAEAQKILEKPFEFETELTKKSERLSVLTDELQAAAIAAKQSNPDKHRTCHFDMARLKKEAAKISAQKKTSPGKSKSKQEELV